MDVERTSTGDIKYPEEIWRAARSIASGYAEAMAISALILAERQRCAALARKLPIVYSDRGWKTPEALTSAIEEGDQP